MQAAILRARLTFLPSWTDRRRALARSYRAALHGVDTIVVPPECDRGHVYHLFPVLSSVREAMQDHLRRAGIETLIHYPIPIPHQHAVASEQPADCPIATRVCAEVFSLPLHPRLSDEDVAAVVNAVRSGPRTTSSERRAEVTEQ
jgi:dTDP-3-amino-3,4,6-trideoxy-alpha-D-glucose transaminase